MIKNNEIDNIALPILKQVLKEAQSEWLDLDSKYREYRNLQIDKRWSFWERFFSQTLSQIYFRRLKIEYNDWDQWDWDLKFNNVKFEIKTSSIDVNKKFQNEWLKKDGDYDWVLFLWITPNELYIKFIKKDEINFEKLHNRWERWTWRWYKWDLKKDEMIKVSKLEDIKNEFEKSFNFLLK